MKKIHYLILMILLLSCKQEYSEFYNFNPRTLKEKSVSLSEIADDISFITLDNSIPLGMIYNGIYFCHNSIYLSTKDNGILVFSRTGKFLKTIGAIGRGPGEYTYCFDVTIDNNNEVIYNRDNRTIKVFSCNGRFLRSFSVEEFGSIDAIDFIDSKLFATLDIRNINTDFKWIALDSIGNIIKKKDRDLPDFDANYGVGAGTYRFMNQLYYWNNFIDTVYYILPDLTEKPSFIISSGEHRPPRGRIYSFSELGEKLVIKSIFETKRYLVIRYHYQKPSIVMIEKESHSYFLKYLDGDDSGLLEWDLIGGITDDLTGGPDFLPHGSFIENDIEYMFGLINSYQIKSNIKSIEFGNTSPKFLEKKKELEKLADSLNETDNPVLVLVRLKK